MTNRRQTPPGYTILAGTLEHIAAIQQIEIDAGALFAAIGMHDIAEADAPPTDLLIDHIVDDRLWIATPVDSPVNPAAPVGFAMASIVDGEGHLDQVSVHPDHGRRGLGTALIERVTIWAQGLGLHALTLTTFVDVAFNGPYYLGQGFAPLGHAKLGPELRAIRDAEIAAGLDASPRMAMHKALKS